MSAVLHHDKVCEHAPVKPRHWRMTNRMILPYAKMTQTVTPDLEEIGPALKKDDQFGAHRLPYNPDNRLPEVVAGFTDGHRLFYTSMNNPRFIATGKVFWLYVIGGITGFGSLVLLKVHPYPMNLIFSPIIAIITLTAAIILTIIKRKKPVTRFTTFDRDTGNVMFSAYKRWPDLVVPFDKVGCYTDHGVGQGAMHFIAKLECYVRPKGMKVRYTEMFAPDMIFNLEQAMQQWAYINRFMDKSQPLPREPSATWANICWYQERGITLDDMMQRNGYLELDPALDWFVWDGTSPNYNNVSQITPNARRAS